MRIPEFSEFTFRFCACSQPDYADFPGVKSCADVTFALGRRREIRRLTYIVELTSPTLNHTHRHLLLLIYAHSPLGAGHRVDSDSIRLRALVAHEPSAQTEVRVRSLRSACRWPRPRRRWCLCPQTDQAQHHRRHSLPSSQRPLATGITAECLPGNFSV
jgi:hypothetical protein